MPVTTRPRATRSLPYATGYATRSASASGPVTFVCSTAGAKRDGLDLRASGWRIDNFQRAGGPVLWCHDHKTPPIGQAQRTYHRGGALMADIRFDQTDPFAQLIEGKVRQGLIRQVSVGWDFVDEHGSALEWHRMSPDYLTRYAYYDLTEISVVSVGSDPDAMAEIGRAARSHGRPTGRALARTGSRTAPRRPGSDRVPTAWELRSLVRAIDEGHEQLRQAATEREMQPLVEALTQHVKAQLHREGRSELIRIGAEIEEALFCYRVQQQDRSYPSPSWTRR